uniref:Uncharacterized protein n=2 Tax=viral metagenome TaxID=1070528 RepID=A0A6M3KAN7_9ZZZZ
MTEDFAWTAITAADNQPGSHNLTGGSGTFVLPLTSTITIACRVKANFAYDTGSNQNIWSWYVGANNYLTLYYDQTTDKFTLKWKDGGTSRTAESAAFTAGQVSGIWFDIAVALDLTTGDTTGVSLSVRSGAGAWSEVDTSWSGAADAKATQFPFFEIRGENGTEGAYSFNYCRVFLSKKCTAVEIAAGFKDIKEEEIFFPLDGCAIGWDRCNIRSYVTHLAPAKYCDRIGGFGMAELAVSLNNEGLVWIDDLYDTFSPQTGKYNGVSTEKFLQQRPLVWLDHWYGNVYELLFVGRITSSHFARFTSPTEVNDARFTAEDRMTELIDYESDVAKQYDSYVISAATQADSLVHNIVRIATQKTLYNYLANSGFENGTVANSWGVSGGTFTRQAGGLLGSYQGDLVGSAACTVAQTVTFTGTKKINVGDYFNFSTWLKSAGSCGNNIELAECASGGTTVDSTTSAYVIAGGEGWQRYNVTHTMTSATSDRLKVKVYKDEDVTLSLDEAWLIDDDAHHWRVLNNNDGASAVESADDADSATYDEIGFDCDAVTLALDWVVIPEYTSIGEHIRDLGVAALAEYIGFASCGTFTLRSYLKDGYADPATIATVTGAPQNVTAYPDPTRANHIIVRGVKIKEDTSARNIVNFKNTRMFEDGGHKINIEMANGDVFPDVATYGSEFWVDLNS